MRRVANMSRGALYLVWPGDPRTERMLDRSIESLKAVHPELMFHVEHLPEGSTLLDKSRMAELTPFDETLYLDVDTVVLGRLDFGFEKARKHGLACCICEAPLARRYHGLKDRGDMVEYNTGVIFFTDKALVTFGAWRYHTKVDSSIIFRMGDGFSRMPLNDQASFAWAVEATDRNPFVLPMNWNFRPAWQKNIFGDVKIWHDYSDVPDSLRTWNEYQTDDDAVLDFVSIS